MKKTANRFVEQAKAWMGVKEGSKTHLEILDIYNAHRPLAHGYEMQPNDAWCACFVSAVSIQCGYTDIVPTDIRCSSFIDKFKKLGVWIENENYQPKVGDIVFYDWEDNGKGDNRGTPNHVGIVSHVETNSFTAVEGNLHNRVATRTMDINAKFLRGFASPKYDADVPDPEPVSTYYKYKIKKGDTLSRIARNAGLSVSELLKINPSIDNPNRIYAGDEIRIPAKE